jgi:quinolinate synthase
MRMNHLDGLLDALRMVGTPSVALEALKPHMDPRRVTGQTVAELGSIPILHMREFQRSGRLGEALVAGVTGRMPSRMSLEDLASWPMLRT